MLSINGKKFLNLPEAVQWLLDNNALPFQSTANYVANTEIAKTSIVNPSPAEIKIGSLVLFADGKVGTVSGVTASGFMVGSDATDLSDGVPHITGITLDASQHLIFTMSEGDPIDAGLVKGISSFSIDASQHLIVNYNDGTTQDLGAIFQGNVNIAGNLTANSIIENMAGYAGEISASLSANLTVSITYAGIVKNGNKLTFTLAGSITKTASEAGSRIYNFYIPSAVGQNLYPMSIDNIDGLSFKELYLASAYYDGVTIKIRLNKTANNFLILEFYGLGNMVVNTDYIFRYEDTFLLSDSL